MDRETFLNFYLQREAKWRGNFNREGKIEL